MLNVRVKDVYSCYKMEILNNGGNDNPFITLFCVLSAVFVWVSLIFVVCLVLKAFRLSPQSLTMFILHVLLSKHCILQCVKSVEKYI